MVDEDTRGKPQESGQDARDPNRRGNGQFRAGNNANPSGRPRKLRELEAALWSQEAPYVLEVVVTIRNQALSGDLDAARLWMDRILGRVRDVPLEPAPMAAPVESAVSEDVRAEVVRLIAQEVAGLRLISQERGLRAEESATLVTYAKALSGGTGLDVSAMSESELVALAGVLNREAQPRGQ